MTFAGAKLDVPFVVCGSGGHHINPLTRDGFKADPDPGDDVSYLDGKSDSLTILGHDDRNFGYLRVTVDDKWLQIDFVCVPRLVRAKGRQRNVVAPSDPKVTLTAKVNLTTRKAS